VGLNSCTRFSAKRPQSRIRWFSSKCFLISPQSLRPCQFHVATNRSWADSSISGVSIIFVNVEGLVEAEAPALEGDTLNLPASPIPGNEMFVAAETDAWATIEGKFGSVGCFSTASLRRESTTPAESNMRTSW
jgi:hypothetical protein